MGKVAHQSGRFDAHRLARVGFAMVVCGAILLLGSAAASSSPGEAVGASATSGMVVALTSVSCPSTQMCVAGGVVSNNGRNVAPILVATADGGSTWVSQ